MDDDERYEKAKRQGMMMMGDGIPYGDCDAERRNEGEDDG